MKILSWHLTAALVALVVLALASLALSYAPLGALGLPVAAGIAALKVVIVALVFMELAEDHASVRLVALVVPLFIALAIGMIVLDVATR